MHTIAYDYDKLGRLVVKSATMATALTDPLHGMHSLYRREIIFAPLSRDERNLFKAARHLPLEQRRVVAHYILTNRRHTFEREKAADIREASRLRAQDIVDDENRRQARHNDYLARKAERDAAEARERAKRPPTPLAAPQMRARHDEDREHDDEMGR